MAQWANKPTLAVLASSAILGALALLSVVKPAEAVAPDPNPWLTDRFLVMAHQGGEDEAPSSTLFAFKSAMRERGADSLELDVNLSSDGQLMVLHDDTVNRTTEENGLRAGGTSEVNDLTAAQIQGLDAAFTFRPGGHYDKSEPASAYPYRGIRTGDKPPPPGYTADDFAIPTLQQVLDAFPHTPINIEIKMIKTTTSPPSNGGCVMNGGQQYCDDPVASMPGRGRARESARPASIREPHRPPGCLLQRRADQRVPQPGRSAIRGTRTGAARTSSRASPG